MASLSGTIPFEGLSVVKLEKYEREREGDGRRIGF